MSARKVRIAVESVKKKLNWVDIRPDYKAESALCRTSPGQKLAVSSTFSDNSA